MEYQIVQTDFKAIEREIKQEMRLAAMDAIGYDGWQGEALCYEIRNGNRFVGAIATTLIYGQMSINYLVVAKKHRNQGIGTRLLKKAVDVARHRGCTFAFLETLNFQATDFYIKHGFELEFSRKGYAYGIVFNYFKKIL